MTTFHQHADVIVIGAGHAGCEAALAAARLGASTLLLTLNADHLAQMSCNPAIGGVAKGQVVREIDALGGEMALNADATTIQFRMLNDSKGAAAESPRAQCDKVLYQKRMKLVCERQPNLLLHQAEAVAILTDPHSGRVTGVQTAFGDRWDCDALVIATGTFLNGQLHFGMDSHPGGRAGDPAAKALSDSLRNDLHLELGRLKTGTPVRILGKSIDSRHLTLQPPDALHRQFSFLPAHSEQLPVFDHLRLQQRPCFLTYSNEQTAAVVQQNLHRSPMFAGRIHGVGARYCPSFEDKVVRFPERSRHHIFLEPEGNDTDEYYLNGISTSLPCDVQWQMIRTLPGLEHAFISRYAYAIEYDFVLPHQLDASLAVRKVGNLFLAGQINGTSGYEEAAAQGLLAGLNAARCAAGQPPLILRRDQAYIGVMIDDLVTKDIVEPYRLFTSRAEFRLSLRQDNADRRLTRLGHQAGLASTQRLQQVETLEQNLRLARQTLADIRLDGHSILELLAHPDFRYDQHPNLPKFPPRVLEQLLVDARYAGYIRHQQLQVDKMHRLEACAIPADFSFELEGLSAEARTKLQKRRPATLGQASRIDGVTPAEIAILQVHLHARHA